MVRGCPFPGQCVAWTWSVPPLWVQGGDSESFKRWGLMEGGGKGPLSGRSLRGPVEKHVVTGGLAVAMWTICPALAPPRPQ